MKTPARPPNLPPRLSMEDYVRFVQSSLLDRDPEQARRQKEMEKRIRVRFNLSPERRTSNGA
ncbi:MAG: hypothetical protein U1E27_03500 [Kiritimatiellia bacterium]|nr:hypothetical protein [Kiritimatiellia bacterium]